MSLALFGKRLSPDECTAGLVVVLGLYLSVIGNPRLDREWADYVSDLPTNVPQTLANVADGAADAASNISDAASNISDSIAESVGDVASAVSTTVTEAAESLGDSDGSGSDRPGKRSR